MSTTIDNLQIEIKSSSVDAASGIDALAQSLGNLKKNGAISTAVKNLNNLSASLRNLPNVHGSSNALRTLANSVEKLKSVGSISTLTNSLTKLPTALNALKNVNLAGVSKQVGEVVSALTPLSSVRAGGLGTTVNALRNLGKVTDSLDDDTITAFAKKIEILTEKLEPLSQKMTTVKEGFKGINTAMKQTNVTVDHVNAKVNVTAFNVSNMINVFSALQGTLQGVITFMSDVIHQASQWDGIKYQFGNSFGEQADLYYEKIAKISDALMINQQDFMSNSAMATSMLIGFGVDKQDAREMGLGYTELAYDIWAAFNNVYETLDGADGAMAAVRSAIAGEVEPIRRAGFTIVEATLEQTAANHGLDISLANATEAQKSYLRYLELVDQAHRKGVVGTYAREMQTAEGMMRTFSQQVKSLSQAFGSLFLPILVEVMPYVQAFVELLADGVRWIAGLFGVEIQDIGDTWNDYSSGAGAIDSVADSATGATGALEDATKAAKELKNATLGIDELNVISPNSATGGAGGGGAGGGSGAGGGGFAGLDVDSLWDDAIFDGIKNDVDEIKAKMLDWLPTIATVSTALAGLRLLKLLKDIEAIAKLSGGVAAVGGALAGIKEFFKAAKQNAPEVGWFAALMPKLSTWIAGLPAALSSAASALAVAAPWIAIAVAVVGGIILALVDYDFTEVGHTVGKKVGEAMKFVGEAIWDGLKTAFNWLKTALDIEDFWDVLAILFVPGEWIRRITPEITEVFNGINDWINDKIENLKGNINEFFGGFFDGLFDGLGVNVPFVDKFFEVFDISYLDVIDFIKTVMNPTQIGADIIGGIIEGMKSGSLIKSIADKLYGFILDVKEFFGINSPSTKMRDEIGVHLIPGITAGMNLTGIRDKLSAVWENAKTWWNEKRGALSTYTPSIGNIATKLSTAWTSAKDWWNGKRSSLSYTPSIGKIWEKLKTAWTNAKNWWSKHRSNLSYTPSIGSISSKLSSAWTSAKNWWNKNRSSLSYTPSIGSIKDKIISAWNTAKKWWSSNAKLSTKLNISVPTIKVNWDTVSAFGKSFKYPTGFSLKFAAAGGVFDQGSLIWAGERGPEVMANASGGRTGVMNIEQMQEAVYEGVYSAMIAAMRGNSEGGNGQPVNIYLDGRVIARSVEKAQRERGASIMGNEVYSY